MLVFSHLCIFTPWCSLYVLVCWCSCVWSIVQSCLFVVLPSVFYLCHLFVIGFHPKALTCIEGSVGGSHIVWLTGRPYRCVRLCFYPVGLTCINWGFSWFLIVGAYMYQLFFSWFLIVRGLTCINCFFRGTRLFGAYLYQLVFSWYSTVWGLPVSIGFFVVFTQCGIIIATSMDMPMIVIFLFELRSMNCRLESITPARTPKLMICSPPITE